MVREEIKRGIAGQILAIAHFLLIYFAYLGYVQPAFYYAGFVANTDPVRFFLALMGVSLVTAVVGIRSRQFSESVLSTLLVFLVIPAMSFWAATDYSVKMLLMLSISICFVAIVLRCLLLVRLPAFREGTILIFLISAAMLGFFIILVILRGGLAFLNFNLAAVYDFRAEIHESVLVGAAGYLWSNLGKSVLPFLFGVALFKKRFFLASLILAAQLLLFSLTSHKELIFYPAVVFFMYYFRNKIAAAYLYQRFYLYILGLLVAVLLVATIGYTYPANLLVMRGFISTPFNHFEYYAFFQNTPYLHWSNSLLSSIYDYPYDTSIGEIIGFGRYGVDEATNANAGFIAMGYAHAGFLGVMIYSVFLAVILRIADSVSRTFGDAGWLVPAMGFVVGMQLVAADLPTVVLSHGFGMMMIMFWLASGSKLLGQKAQTRMETGYDD